MKSYKSGDYSSRDKLIRLMTPVAHTTAVMISGKDRPEEDLEDIRQESVLYMINAIDNYDFSRNVRVTTFVIGTCQHGVMKYLSSKSWTSRRTRDKYKKITSAKDQLIAENKSMPTYQEVVDRAGIDEEVFLETTYKVSTSEPMSLQDYVGDGSSSLEDYIPDGSNVMEELARKQTLELVSKYIDRLPEKEREVVSMFYYQDATMSEIASCLDISDAQAYKLHTQSVLRLRAYSQVVAELFFS